MILTRIAIFTIGLCASLSLVTTPVAFGQESVQEVSAQGIESAALDVNVFHMNQWVSLDTTMSIRGKLIALDEKGAASPRPAVEVLLVQKGQAISRSISDSDGSFQFRNIAPGRFAFVAQSDYSFATFGMQVLPVGSGSPSSFDAYISALSSTKAKELIEENRVPTQSSPSRRFNADPLGDKRVIATSSQVLLQNGDLVGQVSGSGMPLSEQDLTGNVAHIFKDGRSVAAAPVGRDGKFRILGLPAGVYDLVVAGEDGSVVLGFEAVGQPVANVELTGTDRYVSVQEIANTLSVEFSDPMDLYQAAEEIPPPFVDSGFGQPFMGGGFAGGPGGGMGGGGLGGGGMGGGGLGGGGGGGLGGLLGIAGLAVGIAALSQDDEFNPIQATGISPP